jgi:HEAT repeats
MKQESKLESERQTPDSRFEPGDEDFLKRVRTSQLFARQEQVSISALFEGLKSQDRHTRWEAVRVLGEIRDPETVTALTDMLLDQDAGIRWAAMESLIQIGRACLRPLLERFIKDFDSLWMREGLHHILRVLKDRHELNDAEITLFNKLDKQAVPGFESSWTSEQAWAAEKALEALDQEVM